MGSRVSLCFEICSLQESMSSCLRRGSDLSQMSMGLSDFCMFNDIVLLL